MWLELFDKIYVVSLTSSGDRRSYVSSHLQQKGITSFEFHDACGPDHVDVDLLYQSGKVKTYPPCFRCGKTSCGSETCNNVLIPQQVAVFATYLRLWKKIAAAPQRALILEDDVLIHDTCYMVLAAMRSWGEEGKLTFKPEVPLLLRMGWALCAEHEDPNPPRARSDILRMSNPCHAMTSALAQSALDQFENVYHTADVFLHRDVPREGQALTIFPPIASELSSSVGALQSLIHPKAKRAEWLESQGRSEEAKEMGKIAERHSRVIAHRDL